MKRGFPPAHAYAPNLAPMVDVVMVILIFFMLGTTIAVSEGVLPTELPSRVGPGGGAEVAIVPTVSIAIQESPDGRGCRINVMGLALPEGDFRALEHLLREKLRQGADPQGRVLIDAEPAVAYQHVISAMDSCVGAGFANIQFAVKPKMADGVP